MAGLHQGALQQEVSPRQGGSGLGQGEDALIHHGQADGRRRGFAAGIGHLEAQLCLASRPEGGLVCAHLDLQAAGLGHHHPPADHRAAHLVGVQGGDVQPHRALQLRGQVQLGHALALFQSHPSAEHGLPLPDALHQGRGVLGAGLDPHLDRLPGAVKGSVRGRQQSPLPEPQQDPAAPPLPLVILGVEVQGHHGDPGRGTEAERAQTVLMGAHGDGAPRGELHPGLAGHGLVVRGGGEHVHCVVHARHQLSALGHGVHLEQLTGHGDGRLLALLLPGSVLHRHLHHDVVHLGAAREVGGQLRAELISPVLVNASGYLLAQHGAAGFEEHHPHRGPLQGFAKEVTGLHPGPQGLAGQVEAPLRLHAHLELGQGVARHLDLHLADNAVHPGLQLVGAQAHIVGQLQAPGAHPKGADGQLLAGDAHALGILHLDGDLLARRRQQPRAPQHKRADVNSLTWLVQGLVRAEVHLVAPAEADGVAHCVCLPLGQADNLQPVVPVLDVRQGEGGHGLAALVSDPLVELPGLLPAFHGDLHLTAGYGLVGLGVSQAHLQHGAAPGEQVLLSADLGIQAGPLLRVVPEAAGDVSRPGQGEQGGGEPHRPQGSPGRPSQPGPEAQPLSPFAPATTIPTSSPTAHPSPAGGGMGSGVE